MKTIDPVAQSPLALLMGEWLLSMTKSAAHHRQATALRGIAEKQDAAASATLDRTETYAQSIDLLSGGPEWREKPCPTCGHGWDLHFAIWTDLDGTVSKIAASCPTAVTNHGPGFSVTIPWKG